MILLEQCLFLGRLEGHCRRIPKGKVRFVHPGKKFCDTMWIDVPREPIDAFFLDERQGPCSA